VVAVTRLVKKRKDRGNLHAFGAREGANGPLRLALGVRERARWWWGLAEPKTAPSDSHLERGRGSRWWSWVEKPRTAPLRLAFGAREGAG
jgi:hypothetical protein